MLTSCCSAVIVSLILVKDADGTDVVHVGPVALAARMTVRVDVSVVAAVEVIVEVELVAVTGVVDVVMAVVFEESEPVEVLLDNVDDALVEEADDDEEFVLLLDDVQVGGLT